MQPDTVVNAAARMGLYQIAQQINTEHTLQQHELDSQLGAAAMQPHTIVVARCALGWVGSRVHSR